MTRAQVFDGDRRPQFKLWDSGTKNKVLQKLPWFLEKEQRAGRSGKRRDLGGIRSPTARGPRPLTHSPTEPPLPWGQG